MGDDFFKDAVVGTLVPFKSIEEFSVMFDRVKWRLDYCFTLLFKSRLVDDPHLIDFTQTHPNHFKPF